MSEDRKHNHREMGRAHGPLGGAYFVTIVGAAVYFIQNADGFWGVIWAIIKAFVWPGFVVHRALELLGV
jgi:hypothetical protein